MKHSLPFLVVAITVSLTACSTKNNLSGPDDTTEWPIGAALCVDDTTFDAGNSFYVDPVSGDDGNDGSQASPWASIQFVVENQVDCVDQDGVPHHSGAPVKGGDTIYLVGADGHDQEIDISGCYNDPPVRIKSLTDHEARVANVHFRGSANWRIEGLHFENDGGGLMVRIEDHGTRGEAYDIEIYNNFMTSGDLQTLQEYADHASDGVRILNGAEGIIVRCNHIHKVAMGVVASGNGHQVLGNIIEFFTRDGIVAGGDRTRFIGNRVYDSVSLGDGHHDDFFQSHMGSHPDTSSDVEIAYNIFMNRYPPEQPQDTWGGTQCLSAFGDGPKHNIRIYNNVCWTDHYHGITWNDTHNSLIVNNTVLGGTDMPDLPPGSDEWPSHSWISIEGSDNIVRNNLCTMNQSGGENNIEVTGTDVYNYFADWADRSQPLELLPTAPAVNGGMVDGAPADDILGRPRDSTPDVGAYEYVAP